MEKSIKSTFFNNIKIWVKSVKVLTTECSKRFENAIYVILRGNKSHFVNRFVEKAILLSFL